MSERIKVPKGLYGVVVDESSIAKSDASGTLIYAGYSIEDLAERATFSETAFLVLNGRLPKKQELEVFEEFLKNNSTPPAEVYRVVELLPANSHPMDLLRTCVSALGAMLSQTQNQDREKAELGLAAKMPALVSNCYRIAHRQGVVNPDPSLDYASNFLRMITGRIPSQTEKWVFERVLMFYLEHDLNASSFTVRVIGSTLADVYAAVTGGLAALKGPLHGGANENAMKMLLDVGDPSRARAFVDSMLGRGEKVPGFGHRVYKRVDPRAQLAKALLKRLVEETGVEPRFYELCDVIEGYMWEKKKLPANVDFYAAPIFYLLGVPIPLYTPIFAASRVFGWIAHYNEQLKDNRIIRPDVDYVGPRNLKYVPIEER
ncbi:MAG: citrate/2-methylcitrate synthase [Thermoprotei archaeon]